MRAPPRIRDRGPEDAPAQRRERLGGGGDIAVTAGLLVQA